MSDAEIEAVLVGHRTHFPPMLPQDRAEVVNEVVQRISAKVIRKRHAIEMLDGDDSVEDELALIEEEIKAEQERMLAQQEEQMKMGAKYAPKPDPNQAGSKPKPKDQSTKAQAKGGQSKFGGK